VGRGEKKGYGEKILGERYPKPELDEARRNGVELAGRGQKAVAL